MGHLAGGKEQAYEALAGRLSRFPVGAIVNETLMAILKMLYTEDEAVVGSKFPVRPRPFAEIRELTGLPEKGLAVLLDGMAEKGLVVDIPRKGTIYYMLSPMVVGFFEYSLMRAGNANTAKLAELFEKYFKDVDVVKEIFGTETSMFRSLVYEQYIPALIHTEVFSYEKASAVIRESGGGALSICACRHKASHLGQQCRYPMEDICTSLGRPAEWLIRHGFGRKASVDELLRNLDRSYKLGLVLNCDNVINEPAYLCHCCGCCCGPLQAVKNYGVHAIQPSGFVPEIDAAACLSCDACVNICHINALKASSAEEPSINKELCIGCGVCVSTCPGDALQMVQRDTIVATPQDKMTQLINIAVERNRF
ncbi:MAG TPA: 4Fe-4S dicluster domain-containing protein [Candidatus Limnocylindrales bacterium]|nr:4Fe-4S dicluster domain-containing protein [Candidatus Limnocylindrales bacterium]